MKFDLLDEFSTVIAPFHTHDRHPHHHGGEDAEREMAEASEDQWHLWSPPSEGLFRRTQRFVTSMLF